MKVAFFGVWSPSRLGHFIYDANGQTLRRWGPFIPESLDGVFSRPRFSREATLRCFAEWTVLAFEDRTGDSRPGSNGAFIVEGYALTKQQCWDAAKDVFPQICARLEGHVRLD